MSGPTRRCTPFATILSASMSSPESVSSSTAIRGLRSAIWRISTRFFSPPEKPSFRYRLVISFGTLSDSIASVSSLRNSGILIGSSSPPFSRLPDRVHGRAQEARHGHAGNGVRVLKREKEAALGPLVGFHLDDVLAVEEDLALGDLVGRMAHERVGERRLAGAVRPHDRVHLVRVDGQVDAADDLRAVLERDVQVLDLE